MSLLIDWEREFIFASWQTLGSFKMTESSKELYDGMINTIKKRESSIHYYVRIAENAKHYCTLDLLPSSVGT